MSDYLVDSEAAERDNAEVSDLSGLLAKIALESRRSDAPLVAFDLGCGQTPISAEHGFRGVDYHCAADVQANLFEFPWTFVGDGEVDAFFTSHFIEHIPQDRWDGFWTEAWKKLRVGGYMLNIHPYGNSDRAWQDPDHKQIITQNRYWYLNRQSRESMGVDHYEAAVNFDIMSIWPIFNEDFAHLGEEAKAYHMKHTWNAVDDLMVVLRKAE